MSAKRPGLGRSLSALLQAVEHNDEDGNSQDLADLSSNRLQTLSVQDLFPGQYQPRASMDEDTLNALADSIARQGMLQPIVVRPLADSQHYEIIAGERRWRAAQKANLQYVPVIVRPVSDETAMAFALIENVQREALTVLDEARALMRLHEEFGLTHQDIAEMLSKSRASVTNSLRLLQLDDSVKALLDAGSIEMGHARCLLNCPESVQLRLANQMIEHAMSVRKAEALVAAYKAHPERYETQSTVASSQQPGQNWLTQIMDGRLESHLSHLSAKLGTPIALKPKSNGKGSLMISFTNEQELKRLIETLATEQ